MTIILTITERKENTKEGRLMQQTHMNLNKKNKKKKFSSMLQKVPM